MRAAPITVLAVALAAAACNAFGQELEPRAYGVAPVGTNIATTGYTHSSGELSFDSAAQITDARATINGATAAFTHVFDLDGRQAGLTFVVPYLWGNASGNVGEASRSVTRAGLGDIRLKVSTLVAGGPALGSHEFAGRSPNPVVGVGLLAIAPTGQYDSAKLINIGANRWAFKPEIGLSYPIGRWLADAYAGVWLFTDNDDFLGHQTRSQDPIGSFQAHLTYSFRPGLWAGVDATYFRGGSTVVGGVRANDRLDNARMGLTLAVPVTRGQSLRFSYGQSTLTRIGSNFTTFSVAWLRSWR